MSAIRIVQVSGSEMVSVIDEATDLVEFVDIGKTDSRDAVDTVIDDEPDASGRYHYSPTGRYHYAP